MKIRQTAHPALLALALTLPATAQPVDVTDRFVDLGDPVSEFYPTGASGKRGVYDLHTYLDRVYLGYGSTNTSRRTKVLYWDPAAQNGSGDFLQDVDVNGNPYELDDELAARFLIEDGELWAWNRDPRNSQPFLFRRDEQGWRQQATTATAAHNYGLVKHEGTIWLVFGAAGDERDYPGFYRSVDNGETWSQFTQPPPYSPPPNAPDDFRLYFEFFELGGDLYATTPQDTLDLFGTGQPVSTNQPWMIKLTDDTAAPWQAVHQDQADLDPRIDTYQYLGHAARIGDRTVAWAGGLDQGSSVVSLFLDENGEVDADVFATPGANWLVGDIVEKDDAVYVLVYDKNGRDKQVWRTLDGLTFETLLEFEGGGIKMEVLGSDFYTFAKTGSDSNALFVARGVIPLIPEPATAAVFGGGLILLASSRRRKAAVSRR